MDPDDFRDAVNPFIDPLVDAADAADLTPNQVTVLALAVAAAGALLLATGAPAGFALGGVAVALTGVLDLVDGRLARRTEWATDRGDYLDHAGDRFADAAIVVGATAGVGRWPLGLLALSGVLLASYLGTQAQAVGVGRIYRGVLTRAGIVALVALGGVLEATGLVVGVRPLVAVLGLFAVLGHATAAQRFVVTWRRLTAEG